jgi:hypothetical protein
MANVVIVLGKTGSGKSTSIKGLDPSKTIILNVLGKRLPFKNSKEIYSEDKHNMARVDSYADVTTFLEYVDKKQPQIHSVVIDDMIYLMRKEYFARARETGYTKYTEMALHMQQLTSEIEGMREDLSVFYMLHTENVESEGKIVSVKAATVGSLLDKQYNPIEVATMLLYAQPKFDSKGNAQFGFYTKKTIIDGVEIPAKTPDGMFEDMFIPNDLGYVVKKMDEFF